MTTFQPYLFVWVYECICCQQKVTLSICHVNKGAEEQGKGQRFRGPGLSSALHFIRLISLSFLFLGCLQIVVSSFVLVKRTSTWERLVLVFASCRLDDFVAILPSLQSCLCAISFSLRCCPNVPSALLPVFKVVVCAILPCVQSWPLGNDPLCSILFSVQFFPLFLKVYFACNVTTCNYLQS